MALTERSRAVLFRGLSDMLDDEEAVGELISSISTRDPEELATRDFVDARISAVEVKIAGVDTRISAVEAELSAVEQRLVTAMHAEIRSMTRWCIGSMVALIGLLIAFGLVR